MHSGGRRNAVETIFSGGFTASGQDYVVKGPLRYVVHAGSVAIVLHVPILPERDESDLFLGPADCDDHQDFVTFVYSQGSTQLVPVHIAEHAAPQASLYSSQEYALGGYAVIPEGGLRDCAIKQHNNVAADKGCYAAIT